MKLAAMLALWWTLAGLRCAGSAPPPDARAPSDVASADVTAAGSVRYLSLGDSFTIGTGSLPAEAFPSRLVERWRRQGCAVELRNPAVNGYTTQDVIDRELPELEGYRPTFVTLAVGANDLVRGRDEDAYRAQLRRILQAVLRGPGAVSASRLVALPQPDWSLSPAASGFGEPEALAARIERFNAILREETLAVGGRYVDLFPLMRRQAREGLLAGDGLHPSAAAHDAWAEALAAALPRCGG
ncbi:MAG: SGNH/GDSL hydrolase family protein [Deltaproteobacteria bacterium]|nr:SGNH/GDSL hydrolase family protein [Deltaproteobacteria bacterium]